MKHNYRHSEPAYLSDSGSETYMPHVGLRLKRKPGLRERLINWVFRFEPDEQAVSDEVYYDGPAARTHAARRSPQPHEPLTGARNAFETRQLMEIQQALSDWKAAAAYFESVSEPALVDYAVYEMEAAQKRYMYLLKNARIVSANADGRHASK